MKTLITFAAIAAMAVPAFAGPDWATIEQARKAKAAAAPQAVAEVSASLACPPATLALPPAHGPRPMTTAVENQRRQRDHAEATKACALAAR